ncbi:hypothetical protein [Hamadaea tsunoensis]|uniref:hypothetical protein n=1 Tax=Hamadaea tsunoensis TaxID=53368 RepID=UPI00041F1301|nr:hypothetical protein [Hamadaea tsunoensis]
MTGPWQEYLEAAHRLDTVRRDAATTAAAEQAALRAAREEVPAVRARLALQQQRLAEAAVRIGSPVPDLTPGPADTAAAERAVAGGPPVVLAALRQAKSTVDVADAALAQAPTAPPSAVGRNIAIYGALAGLTLVLQVIFLFLVDPHHRALYAGCTGFLMTLLSFSVGWIVTGVVSRTRTALLGFVVCAAPFVLSLVVYTFLNLS